MRAFDTRACHPNYSLLHTRLQTKLNNKNIFGMIVIIYRQISSNPSEDIFLLRIFAFQTAQAAKEKQVCLSHAETEKRSREKCSNLLKIETLRLNLANAGQRTTTNCGKQPQIKICVFFRGSKNIKIFLLLFMIIKLFFAPAYISPLKFDRGSCVRV